MNWGNIPGQTFEKFLKEWEYSNTHRYFEPEAGVSSVKAGQNALNVILEVSASFPDSNTVIVTHGGVICDLLRNLFSEAEWESSNKTFRRIRQINQRMLDYHHH